MGAAAPYALFNQRLASELFLLDMNELHASAQMLARSVGELRGG